MKALHHDVRSGGDLWGVLSGSEESAAIEVLGTRDPLARLLRAQRVLSWQLIATVGPCMLGLVGAFRGSPRAPVVLAATAIVALGLALGFLLARKLARERVLELIGTGNGSLPIPAISREARRLASRHDRDRLARSLERLLYVARDWEQIAPASRPIYGVRALRFVPDEVEAVIARLRQDRVGLQGVALTALLLECVVGSPLAAGCAEGLRAELGRIRFLLDAWDP